MGVLRKKGKKKNKGFVLYKSKKNALTKFDNDMNHRSDEYRLSRVPYIQTK